ncbi:MAG TPA: pyridoxamine 5'-phosphate oxidase family protein [Polyangia bacterium]|nr:pyridoxamine 5'-phosphate oxidase family protein [Polyangia bacterium]
MTRADLVRLLREHRLAVVSTLGEDGASQSAVVGCATSDDLEIVFDTLETTRKARNLRRDPRISLVIGWDRQTTAQIEGLADFPAGSELDRVRACYFQAYPDGRDRLSWPGITHVRVRPRWIRWSDFNQQPPFIFESEAGRLA